MLSPVIPTSLSIRNLLADFTVTAGSCANLSGRQWIDIMDQAGRLIFSINPVGNNLGATYYGIRILHGKDAIRIKGEKQVLNRNWWITPTQQPSGEKVYIRFYVRGQEMQDLWSKAVPLQTISSFANLLEKQYKEKLDERAVIYLGYLSQSTVRMRSLITGLLEYARIGREKQLEQVDCNRIVQEVIHDLDATIAESKATIFIHALPTLEAYPVELKQLFQNLISNAIKFRKKEVPLEIIIEAKEEGNYWTFSVTDNGIGIDEKFHEKIFIIFQRLRIRTKYEGTGIGLAHCRKIVELHGGKIWVESKADIGSIFYFRIPKTNNDHGK